MLGQLIPTKLLPLQVTFSITSITHYVYGKIFPADWKFRFYPVVAAMEPRSFTGADDVFITIEGCIARIAFEDHLGNEGDCSNGIWSIALRIGLLNTPSKWPKFSWLFQ